VPTTMTRSEREAYLAEPRVGIVAVEEPGRSPLAVPVWYSYEPGGPIRIMTARHSRKTTLIERSGQLSLVVQSDQAPYKYVAVQGTATIIGTSEESERRALARRYLGDEGGDEFMDATADADDVTIELVPDVWRTGDYEKA